MKFRLDFNRLCGLFSGQQVEDLDFNNEFQPRSTSPLSFISDTEMRSVAADEPDLEALVRTLVTTARNGDLDILSRFVRMLEDAVQEL